MIIITLKSHFTISCIQKHIIKLETEIIFPILNYILIYGIEENIIRMNNGETKLL